jgi:hypothetical protein
MGYDNSYDNRYSRLEISCVENNLKIKKKLTKKSALK